MIITDNPDSSTLESLLKKVLSVRPSDQADADRTFKTFGIFDYDSNKEICAGVSVLVHPGWAYIDLLWVSEGMRGKGLGRQLMNKAEDESKNRGCHSAYLWTQDFEAPRFYEKLGYTRFVVFEDFIPGHQRIGFMKRLAA